MLRKYFEGQDFYGLVKVDYNAEQKCSTSDECDYICRCMVIKNERVTSCNVAKILNSVFKSRDSKTKNYVIDRLVRLYNIDVPRMWDIEVIESYYGDEIENVILRQGKELDDKINTILQTTTDNMIRELLRLEYGYVLSNLTQASFKLKKIDLSDMFVHNISYRGKLQNTHKYYSKDWFGLNIPIAIVKKTNKNYSIIDGHHRFAAARYHGITTADVWVVV